MLHILDLFAPDTVAKPETGLYFEYLKGIHRSSTLGPHCEFNDCSSICVNYLLPNAEHNLTQIKGDTT